MKKLLSATIIGLISCNSIASPYIGASISTIDVNVEGVKLKPNLISLHFGKYINDHFAMEGRASTGLSDDSATFEDINVSLKVDSAVSVHAKFSPSFKNVVAPYISVGYARVTATAKAEDALPFDRNYFRSYEVKDSESDSMIGAGINFNLDHNATAFIEINEFSDVDIVSFGMNIKF